MLATHTPNTKSSKTTYGKLVPEGAVFPFLLVTMLFALWGIVGNLNDILIRQFMKSFVLSRLQAGLVQSAFYLGYFLLATPSALFMRRWGYKSGFAVGLITFALGAFLFLPAAMLQSYGFFLFALFVIAAGASCLETASNPFIAQLGSPASAERRLNFAQAFNPLGSMAGVLIGTIFIFSGIELKPGEVNAMKAANQYTAYLHMEVMRCVRPYMLLGGVALLWAALILFSRFPAERDVSTIGMGAKGRLRDLLNYPHFHFAVLAQFMYVGAQVSTWSYFIQYVQAYGHQSEKVAGYLLTGTLGAFAVGRFSAVYLMRFLDSCKLMTVYSLINVALLLVATMEQNVFGIAAVFITSFFMSLMYPTIFATGLRGLGANTKVGGSVIVMGMIGGAVLTPLMGWVSVITRSVAVGYVVPLCAFVFVACYARFGHSLQPRCVLFGEVAVTRDGPPTMPAS